MKELKKHMLLTSVPGCYIKAPISFLIRGLYENIEHLVKHYFFYFLINPLSDALSFKNLEKI